MKMFKRKHLLDIESLKRGEIEAVVDTAYSMKEILSRPIKKVPTLRGKTVVNLFFEPSTRTRTSFELAAKALSADTVNFSAQSSSVVKGETLLDTVRNIEAMNADILVIRHSAEGAPHFIANRTKASVVNAGDGAHEHPTQALLDLFTIFDVKGRVEGLCVSIIGDILHSRVARSNIHCLQKMGAYVKVCGPPSLIPRFVENMGVEVEYTLENALKDVDVVYMLRIQRERQRGSYFPSLEEYSEFYGMRLETLKCLKRSAIIMHPGPVNRGVELFPEVADGARSVILQQVTNGIAVRMAILYLLLGGKEIETTS